VVTHPQKHVYCPLWKDHVTVALVTLYTFPDMVRHSRAVHPHIRTSVTFGYVCASLAGHCRYQNLLRGSTASLSFSSINMHEIVTLQLGQRANYLATHFWNLQVLSSTVGGELLSDI
jgi:Misato Segment II myosin-like domain.